MNDDAANEPADGPGERVELEPGIDGAAKPAPGAEAEAVILFAHGSRAAEANEWHRRICRELAARTGRRVEPAFLELAMPDLRETALALWREGWRRAVVVPYLLAPGRHAREDLPALVDAINAELGREMVRLNPIFGEDPALLDVLAGQISA